MNIIERALAWSSVRECMSATRETLLDEQISPKRGQSDCSHRTFNVRGFQLRGPQCPERTGAPTVAASLQSLVGLKCYDGPDVRPVLLRVLTDLYVQKPSHSPEEQQQYVELALRLLDAVDVKTRTEVRAQLATYGGAPPVVLRRLATDAAAMTETAAKQSREPCRGNARSPIDRASSKSSVLSVASELNEIFFAASQSERRLILINLDYSNAPSTEQISATHADEATRSLEAIALRGRLDEFIRELERTMKLSHEQAQRIVNDSSGEPLVVAARALAMSIDILQRILLCVKPEIGGSVRRVYDLSALYGDISVESALRLVAIWRQTCPRAAVERQLSARKSDSRGPRDVAATPHRSPSRSATRLNGSGVSSRGDPENDVLRGPRSR